MGGATACRECSSAYAADGAECYAFSLHALLARTLICAVDAQRDRHKHKRTGCTI